MLLIAQRVRSPSGGLGVNVAAYVHGPSTSAALARDPQLGLVDPVFKPMLMLTMKEIDASGARVVSLLDVVFPDDLPADAAAVLVDRALLAWRPGESSSIWSEGPVAVRFYASPEVEAPGELRDLRAAMMPLFGQVVARLRGGPPVPVSPPQPVRIRQSRGRQGVRYVLDPLDRGRLSKLLGRVLPSSFSIADETREAFEVFALASLERIVIESLTGVPFETLAAFGGAVIEDTTGRILWPS
jgi:hypothetical protein